MTINMPITKLINDIELTETLEKPLQENNKEELEKNKLEKDDILKVENDNVDDNVINNDQNNNQNESENEKDSKNVSEIEPVKELRREDTKIEVNALEPEKVEQITEPVKIESEPELVIKQETLKPVKEEEKLMPRLQKTNTNNSKGRGEGDSESDDNSDSDEEPDEGPQYKLTDTINLLDSPSEVKQVKRSKSILVVETKKQEGPQIKMI